MLKYKDISINFLLKYKEINAGFLLKYKDFNILVVAGPHSSKVCFIFLFYSCSDDYIFWYVSYRE